MLQKLQEVGLYVKLKKYTFHELQVDFFDYIISNEGLLMDPEKIQAITDWLTPMIVWDVQCFIGFANFYEIFIKNYSDIVVRLT